MQKRHNKLLSQITALALVVLVGSVGPVAAQTPTPAYQLFLPMVFRPAQTRVLTAGADAFVIENFPDDNTGSEDFLVAGIDVYGEPRFGRMRTLIKFDLPPISGLSTATLRIYFEEAADDPETTQNLEVLYQGKPWDESSVTFANAGGCGGDMFGDPVATVPINSSAPAGYIDIDVTSAVSNWYTGIVGPNYGFCLAKPEGGTNSPAYYFFTSREGAHPPELVLTY